MCMGTPGSRSTPIALAAGPSGGDHVARGMATSARGSSSGWRTSPAASPASRSAMFCHVGHRCGESLSCSGRGVHGTRDRFHHHDRRQASRAARRRWPIRRSISRTSSVTFVKWFHDTGVPCGGTARTRVPLGGGRAQRDTARCGVLSTRSGAPELPFREPLLPSGANVDSSVPESKTYRGHARASESDAWRSFAEVEHRSPDRRRGRPVRVPPDGLVELCAERGWRCSPEPSAGCSDCTSRRQSRRPPSRSGRCLLLNGGFPRTLIT